MCKHKNAENIITSTVNTVIFTRQLIASIITLLVGILLFGLGAFFHWSDINIRNNYVPIMATITDVEEYTYEEYDEEYDEYYYVTEYNVYVSYNFKGETYEDIKLGSFSSSKPKGEKMQILVNPNEPSMISTTGSDPGGYFLMVIGAVFAAVGAGILVSYFKRRHHEYY